MNEALLESWVDETLTTALLVQVAGKSVVEIKYNDKEIVSIEAYQMDDYFYRVDRLSLPNEVGLPGKKLSIDHTP